MAWCLLPKYVEKFKQALKSGEIDPFKMAELTSEERRAFLADYVGKENAKQVNALFESKLLLKNQQAGMITWAKRVAGISPEIRRDMLARIERLDTVLSPQEKEMFLQDLASARLRLEITQEEAETINKFAKDIQEAKSKAKEDGTFSNVEDRMAYGYAKVNLENYVNEVKLDSRKISIKEQPIRKMLSVVGEIPGTAKSIVASLDNSFWGRQGIKTLLDVRTANIWGRNFMKSWKDMAKQLVAGGKWYKSGDEAVMDAIKADIYSRPNAINGKYKAGNYQLDVLSEEAFPSSLPEKIPLLGRLFKASEVAYNGGALRLRADLADRLITKAEDHGVNTLNKDEARALGHLVGSMTGRGSLGKADVLSKEINVLLFSIKFMKSNIDTLTAHQFDSKSTEFSRSEARKNLLSMAVTISAVTAIAGLLNPDWVDPDPRSTNFGKIKIFGKWTDITGGMASLVRLASYITPSYHNGKWSLWKKSSTGNWTDLRSGAFGSSDAFDLLIDGFFTNKLSPIAGLFRDALRGEMFGGEEFTLTNAVKNLTLPLSIQSFQDMKDDPNTAFLLGSVLLEGLGFSTSTYNFKTDWEKSSAKIYEDFKSQVGEDEFKRANEDYNRAYNNWFEIAKDSKEYKALSDEAKKSLNTKAKNQIRDQVMKEYGYRKRKLPKTQAEKDAEREEKKQMENLLPDEMRDRTSNVIDMAKEMLSKVQLVPEALASDGDRIISKIEIDGDSVITTYVDKDGKFISESNRNIDSDLGLIGSTVGKIFDSVGKSLGLDEMNISEFFGYEDKQKRIDKLIEYNKQINGELDKKIEETNPEPKEEVPIWKDPEAVARVVSRNVTKDQKKAVRHVVEELSKDLEEENMLDKKVLAYALATMEHETAGSFEPVNEGFYNDEKYGYEPGFTGRSEARRRGYGGGEEYFGRGYIQLTHKENYKRIGDKIGVDLVKNPELANDPDIAVKILVEFFQMRKIDKVIKREGFEQARRLVNPDGKDKMIAETAQKYLEIIE